MANVEPHLPFRIVNESGRILTIALPNQRSILIPPAVEVSVARSAEEPEDPEAKPSPTPSPPPTPLVIEGPTPVPPPIHASILANVARGRPLELALGSAAELPIDFFEEPLKVANANGHELVVRVFRHV
jgi:hypothetical protein